MSEFDLNKYLQSQHLEQSQIQEYANTFTSDSLRVLQINDFLNCEFANHCADFLANDARFKDVYGLYQKQGDNVSESAWLSTPDEKRFYFYQMLIGSRNPLSSHSLQYIKLRQLFFSPQFKQYIQRITGIELGDVTPIKTHRMQAQHFLRQHNDTRNNRIIAFILYLSPQWQYTDGGILRIVGNTDQENELLPSFNSLAVFDVTSHQYHYISPLSPTSANKRYGRFSINAWFYKK